MAKRITIHDIAERAGVSYQTVSRVLNNKPDVSAKTRALVETIIEELNYQPSDMARGLRNKNTKTIGLIVPDNANPFFAEIAKGVENAGFEAGYSVFLCNSAKMPEREFEHLSLLQNKGVDGIIFITTTAKIDQIRPLTENGIPIVMFYRDSGDLDVDTIKIDNFEAGYMATSYLINLGHRQIACIRPASTETPSALRVEGYKHAHEVHNLEWNPALMPMGDNLLSGGESATLDLLSSGETFTAIFSSNDAMAIGSMRALRSQGFRIPDDISVIGLDDIQLSYYAEPPLTTIAQPKQEAGRKAIEFLIQRIEGNYSDGPRNITLDIELIERESCGVKPKDGNKR